MLDKQQIAGKERCARIVEDRQVVVGMSRRPCFQGQYTAAEIDLYFVVDKQRWRYDFYVVDERVAKDGTKCLQVILAPCR